MKEQVALAGGKSDGQTTELYAGAEYVEVPYVERYPSDTIVGSEVYQRTKAVKDGLPVYSYIET